MSEFEGLELVQKDTVMIAKARAKGLRVHVFNYMTGEVLA